MNNINERKAAEYLGLKSRQTLSNLRHQGRGPAYCKVGRRIIYRLEDQPVTQNTDYEVRKNLMNLI
jgi:hypothetical protein